MLHHKPGGHPAGAAPLPGDHQHHREPARRSAYPDSPGLRTGRTAKWCCAGWRLPPQDREAIQSHHGPSRSLGFGSHPQPLCDRQPKSGSIVTSTQPPLTTFNWQRVILQDGCWSRTFRRHKLLFQRSYAAILRSCRNPIAPCACAEITLIWKLFHTAGCARHHGHGPIRFPANRRRARCV